MAISTRRTGTPTNGVSAPEKRSHPPAHVVFGGSAPKPPAVKIVAVETIHVRAPMATPRGPSVFTYRQRETLFIKVITDAGITGWGETYAMPGVEAAICDGLAPLVIGRDPLEARRLHSEMLRATFENGLAVGGVDIALNDAAGKALGLPVHKLHGGAQRQRVQAYASLPGYYEDRPPETHWVDEAQALQAQGFKALKFRIGRYAVTTEAEVLASVRASVGDDVRLMADGNAAYSAAGAERMAPRLRELDFDWFEEPLPQTGYAGYPELRARLGLALAGGESLRSRAEAHLALERGCFDIIQPDVSICGGIAEVAFIGELAHLRSVRCIPHCWGGAVMLAATLQTVALLPEPTRLLGGDAPMLEFDVTENPFRTDVCRGEPFALEDGCVRVPSQPGLGVDIDESALLRYAV
jgi:D-galactarolactone cycloisomerase